MPESKETVDEKDKQPSSGTSAEVKSTKTVTELNKSTVSDEAAANKLADSADGPEVVRGYEVVGEPSQKKSVTVGTPGRGKIPNREIAREKMMERKVRNGRHIPQKYKQAVHALRVAENELALAKTNHEKAEVTFKKSEKTDSDKSTFTAAADRLESAMKLVKEAEANLSLVRDQLSA